MPARVTVYLPDQPALVRLLVEGGPVTIGRGDDCDLRLAHASISRRHAELQADEAGWMLRDLGSKNGSHVGGQPVAQARLAQGAWIRLGDLYCEFELLDAQADATARMRLQVQRARATALTMGLKHASGFSALLDGSLRAVMELAHCGRGFLLLRDPGHQGYAVRAQHQIDPGRFVEPGFAGSAGAVEKVLTGGRPVVVNEIGQEAWLAERASVVAGGLRALVCLPLRDGDEVIGAIYADSRGPGPVVTALDMELLEAFAERAALYIVARRASDALSAGAAPRWPGPVAQDAVQ